MSIHVIIVMSN